MSIVHLMARAARRLRRLVARRTFEREVDEELQFHMDMAAARHATSGRSADLRAAWRRT